MSGHSLTFARPADTAKTLAKIVRVDWGADWPLIQTVEPSPNFTLHSFRTRLFTDLADMLAALRGAAINGEILVRAKPKAWTGRRAIHDDKAKGPAGLEVVPRAHVSLDWDRLPGRVKLANGEPADPLLHPEAFVDEAMLALPREWRDKSCIVQVSASAGLKGVRIRTHHILDRDRLGKDIKAWLRPAIERGILDPVTLVEAQPIYLGVTVIGGRDPCPERFKLVEKPGGEIVPTDGLDRTLERNRALAEQELERRDKIAHALRARGWSADTAGLTEFAINKAEAAIVRAGSGSRHPTYVEQMARLRAIIDRHGGDWPAAAHRLRSAYLATLTAAEAAQRQRGSTEGVVRWLDNRP